MAPNRWMALSLLLLASSSASAATLDVPRNDDRLSGIGVIHGWKCTAGQLTVRFNGGPPLPLLYGAQRLDVRRARACSQAEVGFVSVMNWNELGDGTHTAIAYDDGREFARRRFRVVTPGGTPLLEDGAGVCTADDFPLPGDQGHFVWNQGTQRMELVEIEQWYDEPTGPRLPANADLDFLLTTNDGRWTIEVPDALSWQYVSMHEDPEYNGGFDNPDSNWQGGNRYVPGPADIEFVRYVHGATGASIYPGGIPPGGISLVGNIQGTVVTGTDQFGNPILRAALPNVVEVGTLANGLPFATRVAIGEQGEGYSMVVPRSSSGTTQGNRCYILVFDDFRLLPDGGLETQARFYITARSPYVRDEPRTCIPPVYPGGANGRPRGQVSKPSGSTRVLIY